MCVQFSVLHKELGVTVRWLGAGEGNEVDSREASEPMPVCTHM